MAIGDAPPERSDSNLAPCGIKHASMKNDSKSVCVQSAQPAGSALRHAPRSWAHLARGLNFEPDFEHESDNEYICGIAKNKKRRVFVPGSVQKGVPKY